MLAGNSMNNGPAAAAAVSKALVRPLLSLLDSPCITTVNLALWVLSALTGSPMHSVSIATGPAGVLAPLLRNLGSRFVPIPLLILSGRTVFSSISVNAAICLEGNV